MIYTCIIYFNHEAEPNAFLLGNYTNKTSAINYTITKIIEYINDTFCYEEVEETLEALNLTIDEQEYDELLENFINSVREISDKSKEGTINFMEDKDDSILTLSYRSIKKSGTITFTISNRLFDQDIVYYLVEPNEIID